MKLEYCCQCAKATGRAGAADDSLYTEDAGPFCEGCFPSEPPKREWAGLTDEDMDCLFPHGSSVWVQETVKIIQAKLKEKNA
jgi:hypothetical protein